jgi:hypothetical protein
MHIMLSCTALGSIGGKAVVLDACYTATGWWLYDGRKLRPECLSLKDKPLLGGSSHARQRLAERGGA